MSCPQAVSRKARIIDVVYNASNNELVRTQTLVKNAIVQIDAAPFKAWCVSKGCLGSLHSCALLKLLL